MLTQLMGDVAPDIMLSLSAWVNEDAKNYGWFLPLDGYLDKPNKYIDDPDASRKQAMARSLLCSIYRSNPSHKRQGLCPPSRFG